MSTLRSFSFNDNTNITERELELFSYLQSNPDYKCEVSYEILMNALDGRIDFNKEFNLRGYETTIKLNNRMEYSKRAEKEVPFSKKIRNTDSEDGDSIADTLHDSKDIEYEVILNNDYLVAVQYLYNNIFYTACTDEGCITVNLLVCLRGSLSGYPDAIDLLGSLCKYSETLNDVIEIILSHGIDATLRERIERGI
jgi:hypothetical protein